MSNFMDNLRQLVGVLLITGLSSYGLSELWKRVCHTCGWDYLIENEDDGDGE